MKRRKKLPIAYDENYPLDLKEQTIIIELSIVNSFLLDQLTMPMVRDMYGGIDIISFFQHCVSASILVFLKNGLLTDEFYKEHRAILEEEHGIRPDVTLDTMGVYQLAYDVHYLICQYMVVMGHEEKVMPKQDALYGNTRYFAPRNISD